MPLWSFVVRGAWPWFPLFFAAGLVLIAEEAVVCVAAPQCKCLRRLLVRGLILIAEDAVIVVAAAAGAVKCCCCAGVAVAPPPPLSLALFFNGEGGGLYV